MPEVNKAKRISGLRVTLIKLATIPLLVMGILVMVFTYFEFYKTMSNEVKNEFEDLTTFAIHEYQDLFNEKYKFSTDTNGMYIINDGEKLSKNADYLDLLKNGTTTDITIFYYDIRILTTIKDESGNRLTGVAANKKITDAVIKTGKPMFYNNAIIGGKEYYSYYAPIFDSNGRCVGMAGAGKPTSYIKQIIFASVLPIMLIVAAMMIIMGFAAAMAAGKLADIINEEKDFLGELAKGNLRASLSTNILKRQDELGEMGYFTVKVQKFLRDMIERDSLTKLFTRRIGEARMSATRQAYINAGVEYCVIMGDIDHFKRFNNAYGHECGDLVLKSVADILNNGLIGHGYAIRWGGEEFIIMIENMDIRAAVSFLERLKRLIVSNEVKYGEDNLKVTMTFGITSGDNRELNEIVKEVDDLLYYGKEHGRNRIIHRNFENPEVIEEII